jgi:hypothetical protein
MEMRNLKAQAANEINNFKKLVREDRAFSAALSCLVRKGADKIINGTDKVSAIYRKDPAGFVMNVGLAVETVSLFGIMLPTTFLNAHYQTKILEDLNNGAFGAVVGGFGVWFGGALVKMNKRIKTEKKSKGIV